ncbi:hypothetical protein B4125_1924 [Bacillus paralicheniformis]|uniref:Uncharacterized protein n=1 Tax=Bacillus paralicheniformis TaxID=1648923 RepID=A0A7Z0WVC1_9BACI|nr:hypothetical protein SC10_B2orf03565 [Bacillus paralicheniformis]OLF90053.1 hypothetical protein B4121_3328 [Bacillus paralicheniformis]OLG07743.1 hypothetical protein B4125_1924 [Bacillus paralicheniformis]TWJ60655.1 hypothetical protein CHCC5023_0772 [Bacillus paralicheniformis]TWJ78101.1 hypothetical protein CHCC5019_1222 [Bacillus paralicheniformis]
MNKRAWKNKRTCPFIFLFTLTAIAPKSTISLEKRMPPFPHSYNVKKNLSLGKGGCFHVIFA